MNNLFSSFKPNIFVNVTKMGKEVLRRIFPINLGIYDYILDKESVRINKMLYTVPNLGNGSA